MSENPTGGRQRDSPSAPERTTRGDRPALPLLVLGGYLGAGKTTLINELLRAQGPATVAGPQGERSDAGLRIGVLVNDFGALNIDAELIAAQAGETVALTNGCACCSIQDDLGEAFERLCGIADELDLVLVEASGVAHPDKIATFGHTWPGLRPGPTVVVADATRLPTLWRDKFVGQLVKRQIRVADHVVLTRADLAADETWSRARSLARAEKSDGTKLLRSPPPERGSRGVLHSLARGAAHLGALEEVAAREAQEADPTRPTGTASKREGEPTHASGFVSEIFRWDEPLPLGRFEATLRQVARKVERLKGFVQTPRGPYVVQATPHSVSLEPVLHGRHPALRGRERRTTKLVLIAPASTVDLQVLVRELERAARSLG